MHWDQIGCETVSLKGGKTSQAFQTELSKRAEHNELKHIVGITASKRGATTAQVQMSEAYKHAVPILPLLSFPFQPFHINKKKKKDKDW